MTTNMEPIKITGLTQDPLRGRATRLMTEALARLAVGPVRGQASFFDDNGPKGGRAMRCALTVRLPFRPSIHVERTAVTPRLAFDAAFAVLERQLERYRERDRDSKRHPKKYFAARRALAAEAPAPRTRARRGSSRPVRGSA
jgi:ribosome-associated translation inhibitor RaiA